ncbi:hypothetical protein [Clostridium sp.]|uniref:hypothetical protein n=1 Tax=Clostridium sp. TaxID=1506 RepID=UPI0032178CB8
MGELDNSKFSISYGGNNDIDAMSLINSLNGTIELINYIVKESNPDAELKINILGTQKGSFIIALETFIASVPSILTMDNINMAKASIEMFVNILSLKKHLKGSKPKEIEKHGEFVSIINKENEKVTITNNVFNIYGKDGDKLLSKIFNSTLSDRDKISIIEDGKEKFTVERQEFSNMSKPIEINKPEETEELYKSTTDTILYIKKPDLMGNSQWEFTKEHDGKMIRATVNDMDFLHKVREGSIYINSKTSVKATLTSEIVMNGMNELVRQAYTVENIIEIMQLNNLNQLSYL